MSPSLSLITLGVRDLAASRAFYARLGWTESSAGNDNIAFFQVGPLAVALFPAEKLAEDAGVPHEESRFRGVTLARNLPGKAEVDAAMAAALAAGATLVKQPQDVFWGGYSGYFADPDGHLWEVAWNPFVSLEADGTFRLPV